MVDFERKFKLKARCGWTVLEISLTSAVIAFTEFYMEERLSNIFKTRNVTKLTKAILKSPYRVLQVTSKLKTQQHSVYFLRAVEF